MTVPIQCLRQIITTPSGDVYPLYIGFASALDLVKVAEAPAFKESTSNHQIASNVSTTPIKGWQRPLKQSRVASIATVFNISGKLMPNPVLLSENVSDSSVIITPQQAYVNHVPTDMWTLDVPVPVGDQAKPLWILDGQHRIFGLKGSDQKNSPIPLVLLLRSGPQSYSGGMLAEIFAQVTTEAEDLDPQHREWLSYAFQLGPYAPVLARSGDRRKAFETVVQLCRNNSIPQPDGRPNPFCNSIRFNVHIPVTATAGGFGYDCSDLATLIANYYFRNAGSQQPLSVSKLWGEIGKAYLALQTRVTAPQNQTVFFGTTGGAKNSPGQKVMQDAFLVGILEHLRNHEIPGTPNGAITSWESLLDALQFSNTTWNFTTWSTSLSGPAQRHSRGIALAVFRKLFRDAHLPASTPGVPAPNIVDLLKGNDSFFELNFSTLTAKGVPSTSIKNRTTTRFPSTGTRQVTVKPARHIKVRSVSENVAAVELAVGSGASSIFRRIRAQQLTIDPTTMPNPLFLQVRSFLYGGRENVAELEISW